MAYSLKSLPEKFQATLTPNHPMVTIDDLVQMLEIDLIMGNRQDFVRRLKKALTSAYQQGSKIRPTTSTSKH